MKILIWLACILAYSVATVLLRTQGILLGGIPTVLLGLVMVFLPAPFLCKMWTHRKERKNLEKWYTCPKCGQLVREGEACDCEEAAAKLVGQEQVLEVVVKKPAKNRVTIGLSIACVVLVICSCVLGYKVWEFRSLAITFIEENDRLLGENERLEVEISAMQSKSEKSSDFLRGMAEEQAQKVDAEYGPGAYGGTEWTFGGQNGKD